MDSLPKVTLLGAQGNTYVIVYGAKMFPFEAGKGVRVPVPIALLAGKKRNKKGEPLFSVSGLPEIVGPRTSRDGESVRPKRQKQNVAARTSQQGTLEI